MNRPARSVWNEGGIWAGAARRLAPFLDIGIAVVATALALISLLSTDVHAVDPRLHEPNAIAVIGTIVATASLYWRRVHPTLSYCAFATGCLIVVLTGNYIGLLSILLLFALYSLAAHGRRRNAALALIGTMGVFAALAAADVPDLRMSDLLQAWALLLTAWAVGDAIRGRRAQHRDQIRAAEHDAALAREQATRAVAEERLRIARELHDVVAHSMSLIAVQAGVGAHVIHTDVDAAERALLVVAETSREALAQTRSMLGILREDGDRVDGPVPQGVGELPALIAVVRSAGLEVAFDETGTPVELDAAVELAAYRIVQESLTNVLKYGGSSARVHLDHKRDHLDIDVTDPGGRSVAPGPDGGGGHGLIGLRERAQIVGGSLIAGADPAGGFRVHGTLPARREGAS
ncbi:UNVERIFIED_CONTAM: signal transduction histidine kinase [Williamsia faeni]